MTKQTKKMSSRNAGMCQEIHVCCISNANSNSILPTTTQVIITVRKPGSQKVGLLLYIIAMWQGNIFWRYQFTSQIKIKGILLQNARLRIQSVLPSAPAVKLMNQQHHNQTHQHCQQNRQHPVVQLLRYERMWREVWI